MKPYTYSLARLSAAGYLLTAAALWLILGLHLLPVSNGGRAAWVFREGHSWHDGQVDRDEIELKGVRRDLGVRSSIMAPLHIRGELRGVLQVSSIQAHYFSPAQLQLLQFVAYWVGLVAYEHSADGEAA